jgi:hypothetical protein
VDEVSDSEPHLHDVVVETVVKLAINSFDSVVEKELVFDKVGIVTFTLKSILLHFERSCDVKLKSNWTSLNFK